VQTLRTANGDCAEIYGEAHPHVVAVAPTGRTMTAFVREMQPGPSWDTTPSAAIGGGSRVGKLIKLKPPQVHQAESQSRLLFAAATKIEARVSWSIRQQGPCRYAERAADDYRGLGGVRPAAGSVDDACGHANRAIGPNAIHKRVVRANEIVGRSGHASENIQPADYISTGRGRSPTRPKDHPAFPQASSGALGCQCPGRLFGNGSRKKQASSEQDRQRTSEQNP